MQERIHTIKQTNGEPTILLEINPEDLKRFPKNEPFLMVCNRLAGIDQPIFQHLIETIDLPVELVSAQKNAILDQLTSIASDKEETTSLGISIQFLLPLLNRSANRKRLHTIVEVLRRMERPIVPIHLIVEDFSQLRIAQLQHRFLQKPIRVRARIGKQITIKEQARFEYSEQFSRFLQSKIYALGSKLEIKPSWFTAQRHQLNDERVEPIARPIAPELIRNEIKQLSVEHLIASRSQYDIIVAAAKEIPNTLQEIGRLRELTFRSIGEGTGKSLDLDEYDVYYKQLIIWDREEECLVGGYRIGEGDVIFQKYGIGGFYINSLFKISKDFHPIAQQSIELGRSYIVPAYQKHYLPLFLLWKGILYFLLNNPQYQYLYGPVSISKHYSQISKSMIVAYIKKYYFDYTLAQHLEARNPFKFKPKHVDIDLLVDQLDDKLRSLDTLIEDIEPEYFRVPVMIKQYMKLNARFISFNIDPNFSDVLDGFILLNLNDVPYKMIEALKKET